MSESWSAWLWQRGDARRFASEGILAMIDVSRVVLGSLALLWASTATVVAQETPPETPLKALELVVGKPKALFDGESLEGWRILDTTVYKRHGEVRVNEGAIRLSAGTPGTGIALAQAPPTNQYEIRLEARRVEGGDFFCGLTFPVDDAYCTLILGGWGGGATGLSNVDDLAAIENSTTDFREFENGKWYQVRLRVADGKITAWVDGDSIVDLATQDKKFSIWWEQEPARPLGITSWYTTAEVRKIEIERLESQAKPESDQSP